MLQIHWLYVQFKGNRSLLGVFLINLLFLSGCGTMMKTLGEKLSDEYIEFEPTYEIEFASRGGKADPSTASTSDLEQQDYIKFGELSVKYVNKRCFPGEECEIETHDELPTDRLLKEASDVGGDLVKLDLNNLNTSGQAVKNGACLNYQTQQVPRWVCDYETTCDSSGFCSTRQTFCHTEYTYQEVCVTWEQIYGTEYYDKSTASVWRNDPQLIIDVEFGDLFYAALSKGNVDKARQYITKGLRADLPDLRGRYPLMTAIEASKNAPAVTRLVLEYGANPKIDNNKPLEISTKKNNLELVEILLKFDANPNDKAGFFESLEKGIKVRKGMPIINASKHNNIAMVELLLKHKADPNVDNGQPLRHASDKNNIVLVELLLKNKANPNVENGQPLKHAISHKNKAMMMALFDYGASTSEDGVLSKTIYNGDLALVKLFLERGASPNNREWSGQTPLQIASGMGRVDMMQLLLEKGASVNKRGVGGVNTPLMLAARAGHVEAVRLLLDHNAGVNIDSIATGFGWLASMSGVKGDTALSMVRSKLNSTSDVERKVEYQRIIDMLIEAGAEDPS